MKNPKERLTQFHKFFTAQGLSFNADFSCGNVWYLSNLFLARRFFFMSFREESEIEYMTYVSGLFQSTQLDLIYSQRDCRINLTPLVNIKT